jgi:hypothetical protein
MNTQQYAKFKSQMPADVLLVQEGAHFYAYGLDARTARHALGYRQQLDYLIIEAEILTDVLNDLAASGLHARAIEQPAAPLPASPHWANGLINVIHMSF